MTRAERLLLAHAAVLVVAVRTGLPCIRFRAATASSAPASPTDLERARAIARLAAIAARHSPVAVACLPRAIALWWLLRLRGISCDLRLGARRGSGPFAAHAWVECGGVALGEDPAHLVEYMPFAQPMLPVVEWRPRAFVR